MRTQTQLQHKNSVANRLETAVAFGIKAGTAGAIALALSLFMTDLSHWKGTTLGYKWQLSETHVKPGGWVTATLEIPESQ
ncbi:MAG: hypothetical protein NWR72_05110, partial [Bacteroidia bacterium]|nr:hypothetical protein [Bacteroidia bacterium]